MCRDVLRRIRIELPELRQQILRHVPPVRSYLALMESLVRGELARGFDKAKFCFVKSADFPFKGNVPIREMRCQIRARI